MNLGTKINLVLVSTVVVVLTATFSVIVSIEANAVKNQVVNDSENISTVFHAQIERMFEQVEGQRVSLQKTVDKLSQIEGVLYLNVANTDGVYFATTKHSLVGTKAAENDILFIEKIKRGITVPDVLNDKGAYYEIERRIPVHSLQDSETSEVVDVIEVEVSTRSKSDADVKQANKLLQAISVSVQQSARSIIAIYAEDIQAMKVITDGISGLGKSNPSDKYGYFHHFIISDDKFNILANTDNDKNEFSSDTPEHNKYREDVIAGRLQEASYGNPSHEGYNVLVSIKPIYLTSLGVTKIVGLIETHLIVSYYEDKIAALELRMFVIGIILTVVLVMVLIAILEREVVGPIRRYSIVAKKVAKGDLSQKVEYTSNDEIGQFGEVFNSMVKNINELDKLKSDFISVAAHQLRTPLSGVKWAMKLLLDGDFGPVNDDQKGMLKRGYETNEKMIQLVNDLLNVSRIENGKFGYSFENGDFLKLLQTLVENLELYSKERNVSVRLENHAGQIPEFMFDQQKLTIALQNIVDNALKYTISGGNVSIVVERKGNYVEVKISDTGVGIPKADLPKLFSKFFRASNVVHLQVDGSGLGLFIVKNIIERHGGNISVSSVEGKGTTFTVTLPTVAELLPKEPEIVGVNAIE